MAAFERRGRTGGRKAAQAAGSPPDGVLVVEMRAPRMILYRSSTARSVVINRGGALAAVDELRIQPLLGRIVHDHQKGQVPVGLAR